jgi:3-phosphoshikimate 1-carboxyvinyltransferase
MTEPVRIEPLSRPPDATVVVPGSKSLTNRALLAAALAPGTSRLTGLLFADDTEAMLECLARLHVGVVADRPAAIASIDGLAGQLPPGPVELDARLSGTTSRFLLPALALGDGPYRLDGGEPLRRRPMGDGIAALRHLGAEVLDEAAPGHLPVTVSAGTSLRSTVEVAGDASSQFLSGLLLAGPCLPAGLTVEVAGGLVSEPYVEMTCAVMDAFGVRVEQPRAGTYEVAATGYRAASYEVEPDASAASYFLAAAAISGGRVTVQGLGRDSVQGDLRFVDVLESMGASVQWTDRSVTVEGRGRLRGVNVDLRHFSDMAQTLAVAAVFADSPTTIEGIGFIRAKESDRIGAVVTELRRCGVEATALDDGMVIRPGAPHGARIETYDDHRMAMSFALLGLRVEGIEIADPDCVAKTFPGYFGVLDSLRRA